MIHIPLNPRRNHRLMRPLGVPPRAMSCKCTRTNSPIFLSSARTYVTGNKSLYWLFLEKLPPAVFGRALTSGQQHWWVGDTCGHPSRYFPTPTGIVLRIYLLFLVRDHPSVNTNQGPSWGVARPAALSILIPQMRHRGVQHPGRVQMTRK